MSDRRLARTDLLDEALHLPVPAGTRTLVRLAPPRSCKRCGTEFAPRWKKRRAVYCTAVCQRADCLYLHHVDNAELSRRSAEKRGAAQRGRGQGKTYRKLMGRHEHRVVMEGILGRPLRPGEVVHHRDGNRLNNSPENLVLLSGQGDHVREHARLRRERRQGPK